MNGETVDLRDSLWPEKLTGPCSPKVPLPIFPIFPTRSLTSGTLSPTFRLRSFELSRAVA